MPAPTPRIHAAITSAVVEAAVAAGADRDAIWAAAGLASAPEPTARLPDAAHLAVWAAAMRATRRPSLPVDYARGIDVDGYGLLGLACKTAPSLADALERVARYLTTVAESFACELERGRATWFVVRRGGAPGLGRRVAVESTLAELTEAIRQVGAPGAVVEAVHAHPAPPDVGAHRAFYGCPVRFSARRDALRIDPAALDRPLAKSDEALGAFLLSHLEAEAPPPTLRARAADEIERRLASGVPGLGVLARALGLSARGLQRALAGEGTTLRALTSEVRRRRAERLLRETEQPLAEIAFLLGFSEASAFHRAFKRWTGQTPASFRAEA